MSHAEGSAGIADRGLCETAEPACIAPARREPETFDQAIQRLLASAPPLTPERCHQVAGLLMPHLPTPGAESAA